ncbi:MAG: hypothetical protein ACJA0N_001233 [Pseudohongiellaceae bacterium]|jgi:hypothetical protein
MNTAVELQANIEAAKNTLATLQSKNAHNLYPVRFYHIDSLLNRIKKTDNAIKHLLLDKVINAIAELTLITTTEDKSAAESITKASPLIELAQSLQQKSNQPVKRKIRSTFDNLLKQQETSVFQLAEAKEQQQDDFSVVDAYRDTIAQMNTKKFIQQVINEVPKDPGPLNAHKLVIKTLTTMQGISPSYLRRIVNQIDTMFYLNEAELIAVKKAARR